MRGAAGPSPKAPGWTSNCEDLRPGPARPSPIDASRIEKLDSTGAWLLLRTRRALEAAGRKISKLNVPERYATLVENLDRDDKPQRERKRAAPA